MKKEYEELINEIEKNPFLGTSIGKGCYKIRIAISSKGKGKSGGARVITYVYVEGKTVYLLSIYDKSEKENISDAELKKILNTLLYSQLYFELWSNGSPLDPKKHVAL